MNQTQQIPEGWKMATLGLIADVKNGKTNSQDAQEYGDYPLFDRSSDVKRSNKYLFDSEAIIIPGEGAEFIPKYFSGKFDLHQRAYAAYNFREGIVPRFIYYNIDHSKKYFEKVSVGSTVKSLRLPHLIEYPLLLPPLSEQTKIATILSKVDEEIEKVERIIEQTEKLKKGLMQKLLTKGIGHTKFKQTELGEIPEEWKVVKLENICDFTTGKLNSNKAVLNGKYAFFTCSQETFAIDSYSFDQEAILLAGNNAAGIYSVKYYNGKFDAYQRTYVITTQSRENLDYIFLKEILQTKLEELKNASFGSTTKFLTVKLLKNLQIKLPSLNEQRKISKILSALNSNISINQKIKSYLLQLKKGLMNDLLSGKVKVNN